MMLLKQQLFSNGLMKTATLGGEWTMGPLDGGMVLIGKKFSQYLNSQGDPLRQPSVYL